MKRIRKHLEPLCDVQGMSERRAKQRLTAKTPRRLQSRLRSRSRVPQVFFVTAHIVGFRLVLVFRVVNEVLVTVLVYSILMCIQIPGINHIAKTGVLRCCLYMHCCVSPRVWLVAMRTTCSLSDLISRFPSCTCIAAMTANRSARLFVCSSKQSEGSISVAVDAKE